MAFSVFGMRFAFPLLILTVAPAPASPRCCASRRQSPRRTRRPCAALIRSSEHRAHYAIGVVASLMLCSTLPDLEVPEPAMALAGAALIGLALLSSLLYRRELLRSRGVDEQPT